VICLNLIALSIKAEAVRKSTNNAGTTPYFFHNSFKRIVRTNLVSMGRWENVTN